MPTTKTSTRTYTKTRINILDDHFELFLRCGGIDDDGVEKILEAVEKNEIEAVGIYIVENKKKVAEIEFDIDWERHLEEIKVCGEIFDADLPGWDKGVSPEAYVAVSRLRKAAKKENLSTSSWIRATREIRQSEEQYKKLCERIGYNYYSTPVEWKKDPNEKIRKIEGLNEAKIVTREIS